MQATHGVSIVRSCTTVGLARAVYDQDPVNWQVQDAIVIEALNDLVDTHPRWGCLKIYRSFAGPRTSLESQTDLSHLPPVGAESPTAHETARTNPPLDPGVRSRGSERSLVNQFYE